MKVSLRLCFVCQALSVGTDARFNAQTKQKQHLIIRK